MTYANAGHNFPILLRNNEATMILKAVGNRLGSTDSSDYQSHSIQLQKGDLLSFFKYWLSQSFQFNNYSQNELFQKILVRLP